MATESTPTHPYTPALFARVMCEVFQDALPWSSPELDEHEPKFTFTVPYPVYNLSQWVCVFHPIDQVTIHDVVEFLQTTVDMTPISDRALGLNLGISRCTIKAVGVSEQAACLFRAGTRELLSSLLCTRLRFFQSHEPTWAEPTVVEIREALALAHALVPWAEFSYDRGKLLNVEGYWLHRYACSVGEPLTESNGCRSIRCMDSPNQDSEDRHRFHRYQISNLLGYAANRYDPAPVLDRLRLRGVLDLAHWDWCRDIAAWNWRRIPGGRT